MGSRGRIVLPSAVRAATGIKQGDRLIVLVEEGGILLLTPEQAVRRAQDLARKWIRPGVDPVKELLKERRQEVRREMREAKVVGR